MAIQKRFSVMLQLDNTVPYNTFDLFDMVAGDTNNYIDISLWNGEMEVDLTNTFIALYFIKWDGTLWLQDTGGEDGNGLNATVVRTSTNDLTCHVSTNALKPGIVTVEMKIYAADKQTVLITPQHFSFTCVKSAANPDSVEALPEYNILKKLINDTTAIAGQISGLSDEVDAAVSNANTAAQSMNTLKSSVESDETTRQSNETTRQSNESTRQTNEATRQTKEGERQSAESTRASDFNTQMSSMSTAIGAANTAAQNANSVAGAADEAEDSRVLAEQSRVTAEGLRDTAEQTRSTNETARGTAEGNRATAEQARATAEQTRATSESGRGTAEQTRQTQETTRQSAETARGNAETSRESFANKWRNMIISASGLSPDSPPTAGVTEGADKFSVALGIPKGKPGVVVGDTEPTDPDVSVWINTSAGVDNVRYWNRPHAYGIKCGAGRFNMSWNNASGRRWVFPIGTVLYSDGVTPVYTLTDEKPDVIIPTGGGTVWLMSVNWDGAYLMHRNETKDRLIGDIADIPAITYGLMLADCPNLTGSLYDLPPLTNYLNLTYSNKVTGDLKDLPRIAYELTMGGCSLITGDLADLPPLTYKLQLNSCPLITGSLASVPPLLDTLNLSSCPLITGAYTHVFGASVPTTTILSGTGVSAADMDATLIAYAATTKNTGSFTANGKTRTAASDAAVATLTGRGWTIAGITKV